MQLVVEIVQAFHLIMDRK